MEQSAPLSDIEKLNEQIRRLIRSQSYFNSFMKGMISGLGSVIGATLVVAVIIWILGQIQIIPIIGSLMADIIRSAQTKLISR